MGGYFGESPFDFPDGAVLGFEFGVKFEVTGLVFVPDFDLYFRVFLMIF